MNPLSNLDEIRTERKAGADPKPPKSSPKLPTELHVLRQYVANTPRLSPDVLLHQIDNLIRMCEEGLSFDLPHGETWYPDSDGKWYYLYLNSSRDCSISEVVEYARSQNFWGYDPAGYGGCVHPATVDGYIPPNPDLTRKGRFWAWKRFHTCD